MTTCKCCGQALAEADGAGNVRCPDTGRVDAQIAPYPDAVSTGAHAMAPDSHGLPRLDGHVEELRDEARRLAVADGAAPETLPLTYLAYAASRMISIAPELGDAGLDAVALRRALRADLAQQRPQATGNGRGEADALCELLERARHAAKARGARVVRVSDVIVEMAAGTGIARIDTLVAGARRGTDTHSAMPRPARSARQSTEVTADRREAEASAPPQDASPADTRETPQPETVVRSADGVEQPAPSLPEAIDSRATRAVTPTTATETAALEKSQTLGRQHGAAAQAALGGFRRLARRRFDPRQLVLQGLRPPPAQRADAATEHARLEAAAGRIAQSRCADVEARLTEQLAQLLSEVRSLAGELSAHRSDRAAERAASARLGERLTALEALHATAREPRPAIAANALATAARIDRPVDQHQSLARSNTRQSDREKRPQRARLWRSFDPAPRPTNWSWVGVAEGPRLRWGTRAWPRRSIGGAASGLGNDTRGRSRRRGRTGTDIRHGSHSGGQEQAVDKRFYLNLDDAIVDAPSIGPRTAERLRPHGITRVRDLLAADPVALAAATGARHITPDTITDWQDQAQLVITVPWLRGTHAQLLVGAGYRSAAAIAAADRGDVLAAVLRFSATRDGQRILRDGPPPAHDRIQAWADAARQAEPSRAA